MKSVTACAVLLYAATAFGAEVDLLTHDKGIWSIAGTADKTMWIVIHDLPKARQTGIYHVEVLARGKNDPAWKVEHVVKHMAITQKALAASVVKPLHKGAVYPETFDSAFAQWQKENAGKGGSVCATSIAECLPQTGKQ